jgi:hypothetical protein
MKLTRLEIRQIIREVSELSKDLYGSLEKAIIDSSFWLQGNTEDDADYNEIKEIGMMHQTEAAQDLQEALQATLSTAGQDILIAVQSPELSSNPGFLLTPDMTQYPDSVIAGGYATVTKQGKKVVVLNLALFDEQYKSTDINADRIARKGAAILRHEIIHLIQTEKRAKSQKISLLDAFEEFKKDPKAIPQKGADRQQYIDSYIEIDAHAHQAADELLSLYGKDEALRLISKTTDFLNLGVDLPHAIEDYLLKNSSSKTARTFRKKMYAYINSISKKTDDHLYEVGMGIGMDPTGSTMPREMDRSEYKQLETADPENTRMVWSIIDPTGLLSIPDVPPAIEAFETDSSVFNGVILILSVGAVIPLVGYWPKLGSKMLKSTVKALKLVKTKVPPNFAAKADEMLASVSAAHKELVSDINRIKSELEVAQENALRQYLFFGMDGQVGKPLTKDYGELLKVGAKASKFIPDIAFTAFARKMLVRISSKLDQLKRTDIYFYYPDEVQFGPTTRKGFVDTVPEKKIFTHEEIIKWWDNIPNHPDGFGFKDLVPKLIGFKLKTVLGKSGINSIAEEMFDQFPAMKKVFKDAGQFADSMLELEIRVGANPFREGVAAGSRIEITPWNSPEEFAKAWRAAGSAGVGKFIESTLKESKFWAHEFDHWLRKATGVASSKSWRADYKLPDGSTDYKKWASKFYEFEAEFTQGQMDFLDDILRNGMSDELVEVLNSPKAFEAHFLQNFSEHIWQGQVGKDALKRVKKRLFDTERGLYHVLRRELGIAGGAKKPLPESALRELIQQMLKEA